MTKSSKLLQSGVQRVGDSITQTAVVRVRRTLPVCVQRYRCGIIVAAVKVAQAHEPIAIDGISLPVEQA